MTIGVKRIDMPGRKTFALCAGVLCLLLAAALPGVASAKGSPTVSGTVLSNNAGAFVIRTSSAARGPIAKMVAYATALGKHDYAYVYGGGHTHAGHPSNGGRGHAVGYDCSGAVAAVLADGGLWPKNSSVPSDVGMIQELRARHKIVPGPGTGFNSVTLYDIPGHIFMGIDGAEYGTGGDRKGGPGWYIPPGKPGRGYKIYHFRGSALKGDPKTPHQVSVAVENDHAGELIADSVSVGEHVTVSYKPSGFGTMRVTKVTYSGGKTITGEVTNITMFGTTLWLKTSAGKTYKIDTPAWPYAHVFLGYDVWRLDNGVIIGATVSATYTSSKGKLVLRHVKVNALPPKKTFAGKVVSIGKSGRTFKLKTNSGSTLEFTYANDTSLLDIEPYPLKGDKAGDSWKFPAYAPGGGLPATIVPS